jgi:hypothetical protein
MITTTLVNSSALGSPVKVFTSSTTGAPIGSTSVGPPAVPGGQVNAITSMILCNNYTPVSLTNEDTGTCTVNVYLVKAGNAAGNSNIIISNLIIPASETVFLSEERIVLDAGDEIWISATVANRITLVVSTLPV